MSVLPAGFDPDVEPRGGMTAAQVAALALRCGRAETALREADMRGDLLRQQACELAVDLDVAADRIELLEHALRRAAWGKPWILREMGVKL